MIILTRDEISLVDGGVCTCYCSIGKHFAPGVSFADDHSAAAGKSPSHWEESNHGVVADVAACQRKCDDLKTSGQVLDSRYLRCV